VVETWVPKYVVVSVEVDALGFVETRFPFGAEPVALLLLLLEMEMEEDVDDPVVVGVVSVIAWQQVPTSVPAVPAPLFSVLAASVPSPKAQFTSMVASPLPVHMPLMVVVDGVVLDDVIVDVVQVVDVNVKVLGQLPPTLAYAQYTTRLSQSSAKMLQVQVDAQHS
jgi:hypothetical protein